MYSILIVDDVPELRQQLEWAASAEGREVVAADSGEQAIRLIQQKDFDVIVTDLRMETEDVGLDVLEAAKEKDIYAQVIMVTAYGTPEISVETMRLGAFDYLERNAPGTDTLSMVRSKITLALEFREAKLGGKSQS
ncbi:MAG: response regulator [Deltaproteobacteria bacterium]|nr:MAG: response regulator [Deltaproteobacteria bacterium]